MTQTLIQERYREMEEKGFFIGIGNATVGHKFLDMLSAIWTASTIVAFLNLRMEPEYPKGFCLKFFSP